MDPGTGDAELLGRYARHRDAKAFRLLVDRHRSLVYATARYCRSARKGRSLDTAIWSAGLRIAMLPGAAQAPAAVDN